MDERQIHLSVIDAVVSPAKRCLRADWPLNWKSTEGSYQLKHNTKALHFDHLHESVMPEFSPLLIHEISSLFHNSNAFSE